jgi:hypothetical protein
LEAFGSLKETVPLFASGVLIGACSPIGVARFCGSTTIKRRFGRKLRRPLVYVQQLISAIEGVVTLNACSTCFLQVEMWQFYSVATPFVSTIRSLGVCHATIGF